MALAAHGQNDILSGRVNELNGGLLTTGWLAPAGGLNRHEGQDQGNDE